MMDDDMNERLSPHIERLIMELVKIEWSQDSRMSFTEALESFRGEGGIEALNTTIWFIATLAARDRPPTDQEAAELGFGPDALEHMRIGWMLLRHGPEATDVIH